ncbi:MAG: ATP-binding protein [Chloroflexota bacterium]
MLFSYFAILLSSVAALGWLSPRKEGRGSLVTALYLLAGLSLIGFLLSLWQPMLHPLFFSAGQLLGWAILLWGMSVNWRWLAPGLLAAALLSLWPPLVEQAAWGWGLAASIPFAVAYYSQPGHRQLNVPILAPTSRRRTRLRQVAGKLSPQQVESERPVLESLTDGILITGQEGLTVYVNQAMAAILGESSEALIGQPVTDLLSHLPMLNTVDVGRQLNQFEMNGRIIQGRMNIIYDREGSAQGTVAIMRDVTESSKARQVRDTFLATVSHELRTPLTSIKGYAAMLDSGSGDELNTNQRAFIDIIERNVNRMVQLINSLIFASTIKGGKLEYGAGQTDLSQLINQIAREMQPRAASLGIRITIDLDETRLQPIEMEPIHMSTILEELITNSTKFSKKGGEIHLQATMEYDEADELEFAVVSISDDGIGIAPDDQPNIFDEFYRPDIHETQIRSGGIGMGLTIVRGLIDAYNGRIWFQSTTDVGTTFTFIIPRHRPDVVSFDPPLPPA